MTSLLLILVATVLVNNVILTRFLGLCPFMGVSSRLDSALGMGFATTFVLTLSSVLAYALHQYVLTPLGLEYLRTLGFILVIAVTVQFAELMIRRNSPRFHRVMGLFLPLITSNCAVLGVAILATQSQSSLVHAATYGFGAAVGFTIVLLLLAAIRERLEGADVPLPFQGAPIALITAGIMALGFMGFTGMARI